MIFVDRSPPPSHLDLIDPESAGSKELARAKAQVQAKIDAAVAANSNLEPSELKPNSDLFQAYRHITVRDALRDLFKNKCAYCESLIAGSQDTDIEHYRPKGKVTDADRREIAHPGYWWLAMDWRNLVLSCSHCNQLRRQVVVEQGMSERDVRTRAETGETTSVGKKNAFPTANDSWVTDHNSDVFSEERPLLIDPTRDRPENHIDWVLDDDLSTVRAKNGSEMGKMSVRVLGLNRRLLTEDRKVFLLRLRMFGNEVKEALQLMNEASTRGEARAHSRTADRFIQAIGQECEPDQPYSAMAKAFLAELIKEIEDLTE